MVNALVLATQWSGFLNLNEVFEEKRKKSD